MCVCACVRVFLLTLIYLMHWLSRRINAKGMASLSRLSVPLAGAPIQFGCVSFPLCVFVCTVVLVSRSIISLQPPILLLLLLHFYHFLGFSSICYIFFFFRMSLGDGDVQQPIMYQFSLFLSLCFVYLYSCICVSIWSGVRFQRPSERIKTEKRRNEMNEWIAMTMQ